MCRHGRGCVCVCVCVYICGQVVGFCCTLVLVSNITHASMFTSLHLFCLTFASQSYGHTMGAYHSTRDADNCNAFFFFCCFFLFLSCQLQQMSLQIMKRVTFLLLLLMPFFLAASSLLSWYWPNSIVARIKGNCAVISQEWLRRWGLLVNNASSRGYHSSPRGRWKYIASIHAG